MAPITRDPRDPKNLIADSYRIDGITAADCRAIFFDWALSLPDGVEATSVAQQLLQIHAPENPDHPMTGVLREAMAGTEQPWRRGGRAARVPGSS